MTMIQFLDCEEASGEQRQKLKDVKLKAVTMVLRSNPRNGHLVSHQMTASLRMSHIQYACMHACMYVCMRGRIFESVVNGSPVMSEMS